MLKSKLVPNIQLFAEPAEPSGANDPVPPVDTGKTFTEDYVKTLRGEADGYRTTAKAHESTLRQVFGVKDDEELGDVNKRFTAFQESLTAQQAKTLETANNRLIQAELRSLEGYDTKLLAKLIDLSDVKVDEQGNVKGTKEAAEAAAKEFPAVKLTQKQYAPLNPAGNDTGTENNPFAKDSFNLTAQGKMLKEDPQKAKQLAAEAGIKLN